jgi:hypothetical protein
MSTTQHLSHMLLDKETDARFWSQTGFKVGQKLDMTNPTDKAMAKVWADIYAKVAAEDAAGKLVLTYNHPHVEQHLDNAQAATDAAIAHVDAANAASAAGDEAKAHAHREAAGKAAEIAATSTSAAAQLQPPTVSPAAAEAAAHEAAAAANVNAPIASAADLPPSHPARAPRAQPMHPNHAMPGAPVPNHPARQGRPIQHRHGDASVEIVPHPRQDATVDIVGPRTTADYAAVVQAVNAPAVAIGVHENATQLLPPTSMVPPAQQAQARQHALEAAMTAPADFVGSVLGSAGTWDVVTFKTRHDLDDWYGHMADAPDAYKYLAAFDKTDPAWAEHQPINDGFGSSTALLVDVGRSDAPPGPTVHEAHETIKTVTAPSDKGAIAAVGATGLAALIAIFAGRRKKQHS